MDHNIIRLSKEVAYYEEEVIENEAKLKDMQHDSSKDKYDVKRFEQVLSESYMMVPDSKKRLQYALDDLSDFIRDHDELDKNGEWFALAEQILNSLTNSENADFKTNPQVVTNVDGIDDLEYF